MAEPDSNEQPLTPQPTTSDGLAPLPQPTRIASGAPRSLRGTVFRSKLYRWTLAGRVPQRVSLSPPDPWPGDPGHGNALFQGQYEFAGQSIVAPNRVPWLAANATDAWREELHAFEWLRDFKASGGEAARRHARAMVADWLTTFSDWQPMIWRADILGRRVAAWITNANFILGGADHAFHRAFLESLARQERHLLRVAKNDVAGARRIAALRGLLFGILGLARRQRHLTATLRLVEHEVEQQLLSDGGHVERSPRILRRVLADLADIRGLLEVIKHPIPEALIRAIDRGAPMLRMMRYADGGLGNFNDSGEDDATMVTATLAISDAKGKPLSNAPHFGYQRIAARRTSFLVDSGRPAALPEHVHAGTLSFEMCVGKDRVIVNCGPSWGQPEVWANALRSTAAHSTLTIDDTNSCQFGRDGRIGRQPRRVTCDRHEQDGSVWLDMAHDGYVANFGFTHRRRLYIDSEGHDLRGEDSLQPVGDQPPPSDPGRPFTIRFHLHPTVQVSMAQNGQMALLRLPSGGGWQFRAAGGSLGVNPSVYFGAGGIQRRCEQIMITGRAGADGATVKWSFRQVAPR